MKPDADAIRALVRRAPGATIAVYCGRDEHHGLLRYVARDGRMAGPDDFDGLGGWNLVDGPALRVLARSPRPRVWISDGIVNGVAGLSSAALRTEVRALCRSAGIIRLPTLDDALAFLASPSPRRHVPLAHDPALDDDTLIF
jgi:hypothetical protein